MHVEDFMFPASDYANLVPHMRKAPQRRRGEKIAGAAPRSFATARVWRRGARRCPETTLVLSGTVGGSMQHTAHVPKKNMLQSTGKVLMASQRNLKAAKEQERKEAYIKSVKNQHYKTKVDWLLGRADPVRQSQVFTEESVKEDSAISEYTSRSWWVIDPRVHASIAYWDVFTAVALLFTAIFGPVEVAFVQQKPFPERLGYPLFLANRAVDLIFISDMALQFVVGYSIELDAGLSWVLNGKLIAYHYIRSRWFYIDLFSVLASIFDLMPDTEGTSSLVTLRAVRVLRLFKLVRLARGSRIFQRYEKKFSINYAYLSLVNTGFTILFCCHFFACIWGLQASFNIHNSWLAAKECAARPIAPQSPRNLPAISRMSICPCATTHDTFPAHAWTRARAGTAFCGRARRAASHRRCSTPTRRPPTTSVSSARRAASATSAAATTPAARAARAARGTTRCTFTRSTGR